MDGLEIGVALFGLVAPVVTFALTRRDAREQGVDSPRRWAAIAAAPLAVGAGMFLFTAAPLPGVIMTANTGLVLYTFERGIANEDDEPTEPGTLPHRK